MANISYIRLLQAVELFSKEHMQVKRFASDFPAQMPNFGTESEKYPILFVSPNDTIFDMNVTTFTIDIYCFDIIQKDRSNINTILSDTNLILSDLHRWLLDGEIYGLDIREQVTTTPIDNALLDYAAGWRMTATFDVDTYSICEIPFVNEPIILMEVNDVIYTTTLTCDTLADCETFTDAIDNLQNQIDDIYQPLPTPKVKLVNSVKEISILDYGTGNEDGTFNLYSYPIVSTTDFTDEQIQLCSEYKIFIEMLHYRRGTKKFIDGIKKIGYNGYVIAGAYYNEGWPSYLPWSQNYWTRNNGGRGATTLNCSRQNFLPITGQHNTEIPVYEMLNNRFHKSYVKYRDINDITDIFITIPTVGFNRAGANKPTNRFAYSPHYTPYYVAFRFIQYINTDDGRGKIISGPISNIVKITHRNMPFKYDYNNQFVPPEGVAKPICSINEMFNDNLMKCWIETKTP